MLDIDVGREESGIEASCCEKQEAEAQREDIAEAFDDFGRDRQKANRSNAERRDGDPRPDRIVIHILLQILLDKGQQWDWLNSYLIRALMIGTVVSFTYLIIRELSTKKAFLDLPLFKRSSFTISIILIELSKIINLLVYT